MKGFSLIELTIVLAIIGALLGVTLPSISAQYQLMQIRQERETLSHVREAMLGYAMTHGRLPDPIAGEVPAGELGVHLAGPLVYEYTVDPRYVQPVQTGVAAPVENALDLTDVEPGLVAAFVRVEVAGEEVSIQIPGYVVMERLVRAGQLP